MPDDLETLTIRVPSSLKSTVEKIANARGSTATALVRQALQEMLELPTRVLLVPGLTPACDEFLSNVPPQAKLMFLIVTPSGQRLFCEGRINGNLSNETIIALEAPRSMVPWVVLRRDVVGWFRDLPALMTELADALLQQGWSRMSAPY